MPKLPDLTINVDTTVLKKELDAIRAQLHELERYRIRMTPETYQEFFSSLLDLWIALPLWEAVKVFAILTAIRIAFGISYDALRAWWPL